MDMRRGDFLKGMRVLDFSRYLPGPYATMRLADMGADVIKVEDPHIGDPARHLPPLAEETGRLFLLLNRNKRSLAIDVKTEVGREIIHRMIPKVDVVVESYRPGVMARFGLGAKTLRSIHPGLIYCSLTGYGQRGAMSGQAGHDINYTAVTGLLDGIGLPGGSPAVPTVQLADLAGGMAASEQILAAWIRRLRTGEGAVLDVSMVDVLYSWQAFPLAVEQSGQPVTRGSHVLCGTMVAYNVYETRDGRYVALGALEPKFWNRFCDAVERPAWRDRGFTPPDDPSGLYREVAKLFRSKTMEEWMRIGEAVDCCLTPVLTLSEAVDSPLARERQSFFTLDHPGEGPQVLPNSGALLARGERAGNPVTPAPRRGEHSAEILLETGFGREEIGRWMEEGIVEGGNPLDFLSDDG